MNKRGVASPPKNAMPDANDQQPIARADLKAELSRFAEAIIGNISDLRQEMNARFDRVDQRFDTIERRTGRMADQPRRPPDADRRHK
jgi:hypothetical protein